MKFLLLVLIVCGVFNVYKTAKILAVLPAPSYSHYVTGSVLATELARRGHEVTVVSTFKPKTVPFGNYKFVEVKGIKDFLKKEENILHYFEFDNYNKPFISYVVHKFAYNVIEFFFNDENVKEFIKSGGHYDVVFVDEFFNEALYGFCNLFKAACVNLCSVSPTIWCNRPTGNIGMASYSSGMGTNYSPKMSFFQRLHNLFLFIAEEFIYHGYHIPKMEKLLHKSFPNSPPLYDLIYNISMVFVNSHPAMNAPLPLTPNMIELAGMHLDGMKNEKIPDDIQSFLDKHNEGVVYFALGSNAKSKDFPKRVLKELMNGFKKWGKPILWKFEDELPEKLENVKIASWLPQTSVLAHKNVIAFITHGGRLSIIESLYYGVPMIGIPIFAEQPHNIAEMVYYKYGIGLDLNTFTAEDLYNSLHEITTNSKFSEEAEMRSKIMQKKNALDEAVYWIEHLVEFKGGSYLRTAGVDLPWYQFWMVDVIGFCVVCGFVLITIVIFSILKCLKCIDKKKK
nr:UDP-glucuronosyltransferase 2B4-like [Onthophagus taurus]